MTGVPAQDNPLVTSDGDGAAAGWEAVVVGAGVAGLIAARELARPDAARRIAAIVLDEALPSPRSPSPGVSA